MFTPGAMLGTLALAALDIAAGNTAPTRGAETLDALSQLAGRLHPLTVHFPVALIMVGGLAELWAAFRKRPAASPLARGCLWFGALSAAAAAGMGWLNADHEFAGDHTLTLSIHRWLGVATACVAMFAAFMSLAAGNANLPRAVGAYRAGLILSALLVAIGGHFGGSLTHGDDYVTEPLQRVVRAIRGEPASVATSTKKPASTPPPPAGDSPHPTADAHTATSPDFATEVWPLLENECTDCHGDAKKKGKLRLDSRAYALTGGKNGPAIIPGDSEKSPLIRRVRGLDKQQRMPVDADPLSDKDIVTLRAWIDAGAPWPEVKPNPATAPKPDTNSETKPADAPTTPGTTRGTSNDEDHWAYMAPTCPLIPNSTQTWGTSPIDAFVLAKLNKQKLKPSPEAEKGVLLRRVSLDLIGLPPTLEELDAFDADASPAAYEHAVDRLLASPRYGEKWARLWLDLARYGDSHGYEKDNPWSMWPYRDWVISALNADMPFDQFTIEQLAGDLLPNATDTQKIATGFHRCSMINEEGGVDPEEARYTTVVDRTNTTATVWLGTTLACAQCHDHKFDPFTTKDYYAFSAFFNNSPIETKDNGTGETEVTSVKLKVRHPLQDAWNAEIATLENDVGPEKTDEKEKAAEPEDIKKKRARLAELKGKLDSEGSTQIMQELDTPRETRIARRGNFLDTGDKVDPATPEALPAMDPSLPKNRLGLAKWLVQPSNPLTARVLANRIWSQYFGHGIVDTEEDFGTRGSNPTHPELLDYLASELVANHWSLKKLHRTIVLSATYRQSSAVTPDLLERDPLNKWYARGPRFRLEAEAIRDQALALAGLLSTKMGGPSVYPPQPPGIWGHGYSNQQWPNSSGEDRYRRGVYTFWKRATPYPAFVAFDAPQRQVTCTRRPRTNTALQALTTLNDPAFMEAAANLARRTLTSPGDASAKVTFAFRLCTARVPTPTELARLLALHAQQFDRFSNDPAAAHEFLSSCLDGKADAVNESEWAAWTVVANVLLNLDEVLTKG